MEARMFDEILVGLAALKAEIDTINARPLPRWDLKNAYAELGIKPSVPASASRRPKRQG